MKRTPTLIDLHQQETTEPLVQPPTYPQIWTQPCSGQLLMMADAYPLAVALQPYAGTAMVGWTRSTARKVLVRLAGSTTYARADVTVYMVPPFPVTVYDAPAPSDIDGVTDGVTVKLAKISSLEGGLYLLQGWPTENNGVSTVVTTTDAIVASPAADLDRQIEITAQKAPQVEPITVNLSQAVTIWTGARTNDLTSL
jgi:hypothetical protein